MVFFQHMGSPTHFSAQKDSCLDLVCSNSNNVADTLIANVNISDYEMVLISRKHIKIKDKKKSFVGRSYKNYDQQNFINNLQNENWGKFENDNDPTILWNHFSNRIKSSIATTCPLKRFKVRITNKPSITNELMEQIKDKDRALKRAKRTKNNDDWRRARLLRNDGLRCLRQKSDFIQNELNLHLNDSKKLWDNVLSILPNTSEGSHMIKLVDSVNGHAINEESTADFINNIFTNIGHNLVEKLNEPWFYKARNTNVLMGDVQTTLDEVVKLIKKIDVSKSSAIEHLSSRIIKDAFLAVP